MDLPDSPLQRLLSFYRSHTGLSQASLALLAGCSRQYVLQLEMGQPDFQRLWRSVEPAPDGAPTIPLGYRHSDDFLGLRVVRLLFLNGQDLWMILFMPEKAEAPSAFTQS